MRKKQKTARNKNESIENTPSANIANQSNAEVVKPPYSYAQLINEAISSSKNKQLTLREIYKAIQDRHPYYTKHGDGWKNSIRHNLSLSRQFRKIPKDPMHPTRKGSFWGLVTTAFEPKVSIHLTEIAPKLREKSKQTDIIDSPLPIRYPERKLLEESSPIDSNIPVDFTGKRPNLLFKQLSSSFDMPYLINSPLPEFNFITGDVKLPSRESIFDASPAPISFLPSLMSIPNTVKQEPTDSNSYSPYDIDISQLLEDDFSLP